MKRYWPFVAASVLALVAADSALAKHRHRVRVPAGSAAIGVQSPFAPARIIQARPGVFISSYDCITDDGYGRWRPCSDKK